MGMSKIEVIVTGSHGCDRKAKEGDRLGPLCDGKNCIDCITRRYVQQLKDAGCQLTGELIGNDGVTYVHGARMTHWPYDPNGGITDDLVAEKRVRNGF